VTKPAKPAVVNFYIDADLLGLAKLLAQIRSDVTYPGDLGGRVRGGRVRPACVIRDTSAPDTVWIRECARQGWLIITRDRHIQEHRAEVQAVRDTQARMVTLVSREAVDTFHQLEVIMCQWRRIEESLTRPGPFIVAVSRTSFKDVPVT
jgi:uncharacterized protein with PIN domain